MAPPAKKVKTDTSAIPVCPYGARCYRKNPQHLKEYSHPKDDSGDSSSTKTPKATTKATADSSKTDNNSPLPPCKYGASCYRKNLLHFAEYSHPTKKANDASDDGSDTDPCDSDDDTNDGKKVDSSDILSRGLSLVKTFSKMTEDERKELIKRALEEKKRLEEELDGAKKEVAKKDKELQHLQQQVNTGQLLMEGEAEAMKSDKTTYFSMFPERAYKEGSADQVHFRLAESQFYRLLLGDGNQLRVTKVDYVVTPKLIRRFKKCQENLKTKRGEACSYPVLGFHGTNEQNIKPIVEGGFKTPKDSGFQMKTDTGWYGAGVYFSEYPSYSMSYISGSNKLMLCQVLPGKVYKCTKLIHGAELRKGFDSHVSPCGKELIIFDSHAILPAYVVYYDNANSSFSYKSSLAAEEHPKALAAKATKVFSGLTITVSGTLKLSQAEAYKLILKHGGKKGTAAVFDILVAGIDEWNNKSNKVITAEKKKIPVVTESFLYQSIMQNKKMDVKEFEHDIEPLEDNSDDGSCCSD